MITFNSVSKIYGNYHALDDVSFRIEDKEFVSLVGRSGAGKSTVVKLLLKAGILEHKYLQEQFCHNL